METYTFFANGVAISKTGFGTWQMLKARVYTALAALK